MTFVASTPPHAARGEVLQMYARQQQHWGYVPNYALAFSHRPEIMAHWASLLAGIRRNIEPRRFELVTLAAAHALRNSYCALAHGRALTEHLPAHAVLAIARGREAQVLSPADAAMVRFARKVASDAAAVSDRDIETLRAHGFSDEAIFDIVLTAAARAFFSKVLDGVGALADAGFMHLDAPLRRALTVGRPIAQAPSATLQCEQAVEGGDLAGG